MKKKIRNKILTLSMRFVLCFDFGFDIQIKRETFLCYVSRCCDSSFEVPIYLFHLMSFGGVAIFLL